MCADDSGNSSALRAKTVAWKCNGSDAAQAWSFSGGEYVLKAHGGTLCLDDPAYSTRNGTQLIVYACNNGANQHWSLP